MVKCLEVNIARLVLSCHIIAVAACGGELLPPSDGGCIGPGCDDATTCRDGSCDDPEVSDEPIDNPGLTELCDGLDNDCDGVVDDGLSPRPCSTNCSTGEERCEGGSWSCSAPTDCECTPAGNIEEEECGYCGRHTRLCTADLTWETWDCTVTRQFIVTAGLRGTRAVSARWNRKWPRTSPG